MLSFLYGPTLTSIQDYWKNHNFDFIWTFVGKAVSLLYNMLSRFVTPFLPRSKCLLILWLQSVSAVILKPPVWGAASNPGKVWIQQKDRRKKTQPFLPDFLSEDIEFLIYNLPLVLRPPLWTESHLWLSWGSSLQRADCGSFQPPQ